MPSIPELIQEGKRLIDGMYRSFEEDTAAKYQMVMVRCAAWMGANLPTLLSELERVTRERDAAVEALGSTDPCQHCMNYESNELFHDDADGADYPRRYKCDSCYLGGGEHNNFEWRTPQQGGEVHK